MNIRAAVGRAHATKMQEARTAQLLAADATARERNHVAATSGKSVEVAP
jgi:hypothetical protein